MMTAFLICIAMAAVPDSLLDESVFQRTIEQNTDFDIQDAELLLNIGIYHRINVYRVEKGKSTLRWNDNLMNTAGLHSKEMYERDFFSHVNPKNKALRNVDDRLKYAKADFNTFGENIAFFDEPLPDEKTLTNELLQQWIDGIFTQWRTSKGHRKNMLRDAFKQTGISCYLSVENVNQTHRVIVHATNVFTD